MRLLVQHPGDVSVTVIQDADLERPLVEIIAIEEDELLWIDGCDEPIELHLTLVEVGIDGDRDVVHGHRHTCRKIHTQVTYVGRTKKHTVGPNTTLEALLNWAIKEFRIDATTAADLVFRLVGSPDDLDFARHVGSLTKGKTCEVDLDLLPGDTHAG
jgi:hypothetical protein